MTRDELLEMLAEVEKAANELRELIGDVSADIGQAQGTVDDVPEPLVLAVLVWTDGAAPAADDLEREVRGLVDRVRRT